ncbi:MAG: hypothetical protein DYG98_23000 [Haliscomenobacteraceae bacterium CHB4]|nr:hypothetical protein [Saprospiraceae bacterium]MCE7925928.1 hypothetical protein [Haliscomenobacteraceae bacterium CHB4]
MPDILTIPRTSSFPPYLDFAQLRAAGIRHLEELGSDLWTDFNVHDPGITILEVLCYALTDLGYRTNFDIKDLLARSTETKKGESKTIFGLPWDDNFFTAAEVLSCNPVTVNDLRKLLIDIPGVKNAWFLKAPEGELPIYLNRKQKALDWTPPFPEDDQQDRILLRGLYDVHIELDEVLTTDACGRTFFSKDDILQNVYKVLHAHRNLCEDIREVLALGDEQIAVCADIELIANADPEDVLLEIYKRVEEFLSPTLRFYTLREMIAKGVPVEEIFAGRPLTATSHGFIDLAELEKIQLKDDLHISDIYQVIMDIPGVAAVRNLALANYIDGVAFTKGEKWCLPLKPFHRPHFDLDQSQIMFFKGVLPFNARKKEVAQRYNEEKAAKKKAYLDPYHLDLPIPEGTYRDLEEYTSIMEEFPLTYGVGRMGIKQPLTPIRQGQAKQLKGFLLFFDQLLANYLAQLAHLRELFSIRPDGSPEREGNNHTYFTHILTEAPGIEVLVRNFHECSSNNIDAPPPEDYPSYLRYIVESLETYQDRRNRFLDHLLARFAESFADYVLLSYKLGGGRLDPAHIIQDKADFLRNYPEISRNRGKGMDYTAGKVWDTDNISGLEKRVSKLVGIDNATRHTLSPTRLVETEAGWAAEINGSDGTAVMLSKSVWPTETAACDAVAQWAGFIASEQNFRRLTFDVAGDYEYFINIVTEEQSDSQHNEIVTVAIGLHPYPSEGRYCEAVKKLLKTDFKVETAGSTAGKIWYFYIQDTEGNDILRSRIGYINEDLARTKGEEIKSLLSDEKYYCLEKRPVLHNNEYGFFLLDDAGNIIAESTKRYMSAGVRDSAIHELVNSVVLPGLTCGWDRESNCFYFELYDYSGKTRLFVSSKGFHSKEDAIAFFDKDDTTEDFKGWAVQSSHYEKTGEDGYPYSFQLKDKDYADPTGTVRAIHPHEYETEKERDDRLQAIIYYLDDIPPQLKIEPEKPGDFQFDITDAKGKVLLKSTLHYTTQVEAENASWKVRSQARHRVYYKPNTSAPYSFVILDRHGEEIAYHPHSYDTECERDLAIDTLIYGSQNIEVQHRIEEQSDGFHYVLLSPEGDALMTGLTGFSDADQADAAFQEFLGWAMHKDHYHISEETGVEYPFGFDLWNDDGHAVATSVKKFATRAEAKMAIRAIRNYVCHTEWTTVFTITTPGEYGFQLIGENDRVLLKSAVIYPDKPSALLAYEATLLLAGDKNRYFDLPGFGFDLRDADGNTIALHPDNYANANERDAAKNLIISYVRTDAPRVETPNTGGAFYGVILGRDGSPAFTGIAVHPNRDAAQAELDKLLLLATDRDRYKPHDDGYTACQFGFYLTDENDATVARHPKTYPSAAERDKAMLSIFAWLTDGEALADDVVQGKSDFRFALQNKAGQRMLVSALQFDTVQDAEAAFDPFLEHARIYERFEKFTKGPGVQFGFRLTNEKGNVIALHDTLYPTDEAREDAIIEIIRFVALRGAAFRFFEDDGVWKYALKNAEDNDVLIDAAGASDKIAVAENLEQAFVWAQQQERYLLLDDDVSCAFGFALTNEENVEIARHPATYETSDLRDEAIATFITYLTQLALEPEVFEVQGTFYFQLTDFSGNILLQSKKDDFPTAAATKNAWNQLVQAVNDPANFQVIYDNAHCQYTVGILVNGQIIACPPYTFSSRTAVNEWIDTLLFLLKKHPVSTEIPGTTCGYFFTVEHTGGDGTAKKLLGVRRYPTDANAQHACHELAVLLRSENTFKIEEFAGKWFLTVYDGNGQLVAKSAEPPFESDTDAQAVYDEIVGKLSGEVVIPCNPVYREHEYRCELSDGQHILQSVPGKAFIRFGRSDRTWASRAVRDAMVREALSLFNTPNPVLTVGTTPENGTFRYMVDVGLFRIESDKMYPTEQDALDAYNHPGNEGDSWLAAAKNEANYQPLDDEINCRFGFEIIETEEKDAACQECNQLLELAQQQERYSLISNEEECLFGFELTDPEGVPIASSPEFYPTEAERDAAIAALAQSVNSEGMHLVEHLLLRPRKKALEQRFVVECRRKKIVAAKSKKVVSLDVEDTSPLLRCADTFGSEADARRAFWKVMAVILGAKNGQADLIRIFRENTTTGGTNESCWHIEVLERVPTLKDPVPKVLAFSPEGCCDNCTESALRASVYQLVEGYSAIDENNPPADLPEFADIHFLPRLYDDLEQDDLLPIIGDCADPSRMLPPDLSDPYSFRATVVLPYWPARFQKSEFRSFLETTLRQEAPAHVFLRICWVDACQMREFEAAFRRWLESKATGELSCDSSTALNALIDILFRLRNIYPAGTLHDCAEPAPNANPIVLNYSIIGSANSDSHGNQ